jgi:hypothetical protein
LNLRPYEVAYCDWRVLIPSYRSGLLDTVPRTVLSPYLRSSVTFHPGPFSLIRELLRSVQLYLE